MIQRILTRTESQTCLQSFSVKNEATLNVGAGLYLDGYNGSHHSTACQGTG